MTSSSNTLDIGPERFGLVGALLVVLATTGLPGAARADGEFVQLDLSSSTTAGVASIQRGALTFGGGVTIPDGDPSASPSLLRVLPLLFATWTPTLRLGLALSLSGEKLSDAEVGGWMVLERYMATGWGNVYGLAEAATVDQAWFLLGQVGLNDPRMTAGTLSRWQRRLPRDDTRPSPAASETHQ